MCEAFSLQADTQELTKYFQIDQVLNGPPPQEMITPTGDIPVILDRNGNRCLDRYTWGIFPFWAKDSVNACSETIREHKAYRKIFAKQRCIIPCDGFYIQVPLGKKKVKHIRISVNERRFIGMAALYDVWLSPSGSEYRTCTILTTAANEPLSPYHSRMPVILDEDAIEVWLTARSKDTDRLPGLMKPYRNGTMSILH